MFSGIVELHSLRDLLVKIVTYSLTDNHLLSVNAIPVLKGNNLRLFDRTAGQITQFTLDQTTRIDSSTAYCYFQDSIVICCGGEVHDHVYEVDMRS